MTMFLHSRFKTSLWGLVLIYSSLAYSSPNLPAPSKVLKSQDCVACHQQQAHKWQQSDHAMAMADPSSNTVLGNFDNQHVSYFNQSALFFISDGNYKTTITYNSENNEPLKREQTFTVKYTFGHYPLQQYLVETKPGQLQVLPFAWDARKKSEGGQRWYHNYNHMNEDIAPNDRLHWQQRLQNWNGMCADCHSDELTRNYHLAKDQFNTQYSGINVGCVSCHGSTHPTNKTSAETNFIQDFTQQLKGAWIFDAELKTASWKGEPRNNQFMDTCFACHSLRSPLKDGFSANTPFLDNFSPQTLSPPNYFPDGQIKEEVYVYGSFLQSKMFAKGVNCIDCHDAHTMKIKVEGNGLCLQCHKATEFNTPKHHQHLDDSAGAQCVNCHMPDKVYMGVDNRRDHSFKIPRPDISENFDTPNACIGCHQDKSNKWAKTTLKEWFGTPSKLSLTQTNLLRLRHGEQIDLDTHLQIANDKRLDTISRATAIEMLNRTTQSLAPSQVNSFVYSKEPLIRLAIVKVAQLIPENKRLAVFEMLLSDSFRAIRVAAAQALLTQEVGQQNRAAFTRAFTELTKMNKNNAWRGEGRVNVGNNALHRNNLIGAEIAYQGSIDVDPYFDVGYMNLADLYRAKQQEEAVAEVLMLGMQNVPKSADINYAYGLHLVRIKKINEAVGKFAKAIELQPYNEQFAYTYILALDGAGKSLQALTELKVLLAKYEQKQQLIDLGLYLSQKLNKPAEFDWFREQNK